MARRKNFTKVQEFAFWVRDLGHCRYCEQFVMFNEMHLDHIHPISKGGSNSIMNITVACPSCNQSKYNKNVDEFVAKNNLSFENTSILGWILFALVHIFFRPRR